jgi:hypothetical protein
MPFSLKVIRNASRTSDRPVFHCAEVVLSDMFLEHFVDLVSRSCERRGPGADSPLLARAAMAAVAWVVTSCEDVNERYAATVRLLLLHFA